MAAEWDAFNEGERISWSLDWDQEMGSHLPFLQAQYLAGAMTRDQQARYRKRLKQIKGHTTIIERLGLSERLVPLAV